ncbi:HNH endonuclease [Nonomuraea lactucae]|uniref:HNH endonuclease n=1 Tax=Nonomuraea lactucae TaxID=2249762 RepID=UPI0019627D44|nr:HNH endonuclease [Nonomuraea lactucae]
MRRHRPRWLQGAAGRKFRRRLAVRHGWRCFYCRKGFPNHTAITADHFIPLSVWRRGYPKSNLVPACKPCNRAKDDQLPRGLVLVLLSVGTASATVMQEAA